MSNLKSIRIKSGLTQKQVAEKVGILVQAYQAYEYGKYYPTVNTAIDIAKALNSTVEEIWTTPK